MNLATVAVRGAVCAAVVLLSHVAANAGRTVTEEAVLFERLEDGVFTIYSEYGQGSGFLISEDGLVLTNAHVLGTSEKIRVTLDPDYKVEAVVVALDDKDDLALVRIHPDHCVGRPVLPLAMTPEERAMVGERVLAIGSPLSQEKVLTSGIVSRVHDEVIISDVNINPGNSGGPMINLDGNVVGVNTFGESADAGPGLSGTVDISVAEPLLEKGRRMLEHVRMPETRLYPCAPRGQYPLVALERAAVVRKWPDDHYDAYTARRVRKRSGRSSAGGSSDATDFQVQIMTPPRLYNLVKRDEIAMASSKTAGAYDPFNDLKDWSVSLGQWRPVVTVAIVPRIGATTGSQVASFFSSLATGALAGVSSGHLNYEYRGDVERAELWVDGELAEEYLGYLDWIPMSFHAQSGAMSASGEGLARSGVLIVDPDYFFPVMGRWRDVEVRIWDSDEEEKDNPTVIEIPRATLERVVVDFDAWYQHKNDATQGLVVGRGN